VFECTRGSLGAQKSLKNMLELCVRGFIQVYYNGFCFQKLCRDTLA
jgi:hypothetical protein